MEGVRDDRDREDGEASPSGEQQDDGEKVDEEQQAMMAAMGFGNFGTTKVSAQRTREPVTRGALTPT